MSIHKVKLNKRSAFTTDCLAVSKARNHKRLITRNLDERRFSQVGSTSRCILFAIKEKVAFSYQELHHRDDNTISLTLKNMLTKIKRIDGLAQS